ncbi:MAG: GvpL/GvpF family gas vesicle protein, partial [candidate division NC10 bacterium]
MARTYIYGVIPSGQSLTFGLSGFPPRPEEVRTVAFGGLTCVVSNYSGEDFASLPKETLLRCLMAHQEVVERVMQAFPVLPVKFGTLVESEAEAERFIEQSQGRLGQALERLTGKMEMEVAATWDLKRVLEEVGQADEILRLRESIAGRPATEVLEVQIQAGKIVKESLDRRREEFQQRLLESLGGAALDAQPNALVADEMVLNVAFLIEKKREEEFDEQVRKLDEALNGEVSFRIVGPLPPYSFATVEVARPSVEKLEEARRLLGLGASVSQAEVKQAFRRLAA